MKKLSIKLLLAILPAVILTVSGIVWFQYAMARRVILASVNEELGHLAQRTAVEVDDQLEQRERDLLMLSETPLIVFYYKDLRYDLMDEAAAYREQLQRYLSRFAARDQAYAVVAFLDQKGRVVCRVASASNMPEFSSADFGRAVRLPPGAWRTSLSGGAQDRPILYYAKPVRDELGRLEGMMVLGYDLSRLGDRLRAVAIGKGGGIGLELENGRILGGAAPEEESLTASGPLAHRPWKVIVNARRDDFLGPLRNVRHAAVAISLAGVAMLGLILLIVVRSIVQPIAALSSAAQRIGHGELSYRVAASGTDELGMLSRSFNEMAGRLESNRGQTEQLQAQLIQSEKLSAVGQLISAVAHELSNPLASVSSYVELARLDGCPPQMRDDLKRVHDNVFRCRKVVEGLLVFARQSRRERKRVDLNVAANAALELLEYRLVKTEGIRVVKDLSAQTPAVAGDFQQIVQVLVNLIVNACDAMASATSYPTEKLLTLRTGQREGQSFVEVEDNGPGVPQGLAERIFQPFFTTKEPGRGTGLGLSICRQIAQEHGGDVALGRAAETGSVFRLTLPSASDQPFEDEGAAGLTVYDAVPGKRVLVADDEKDLADAMERLLREDGDLVRVAYNGAEARRLIEEGSYDLVVSDIEMEHCKGTDLHAALAAKGAFPACKMLFVTGDILNPKVLDFLSKTGSDYLAKPFDIEEFRQAARRLLAA